MREQLPQAGGLWLRELAYWGFSLVLFPTVVLELVVVRRKRGKKEGYRERERESRLPDFTISVNGYFQQYHVSLASPSIPIGLYHYWIMILLLVTKRVPIKQ